MTTTIRTYKFSATPKPDGTVRFYAFRVADSMGVGSWVILNRDGTVNSSDQGRLPAEDVLTEMREALAAVLTGTPASASTPVAASGTWATLNDQDLLAAIEQRAAPTPIVGLMRSHLLRAMRRRFAAGHGTPDDRDFGEMLDIAWAHNAHTD